MAFLRDWGQDERVYLQADAFGGYDGSHAGEAGGRVTEVACWAHARRKFYDARHSDPEGSAQALAYIRRLYDVDKQAKKRHSVEQIISKLREGEVALAKGQTIAPVCRKIQITEQTYYRWRKEYGGLRMDQAKRLNEVEKDNARPRKVVADLTLDNAILRETANPNC